MFLFLIKIQQACMFYFIIYYQKSYYVLKNYYLLSLDVLLAMHILSILHSNKMSMQIVKTWLYSLSG